MAVVGLGGVMGHVYDFTRTAGAVRNTVAARRRAAKSVQKIRTIAKGRKWQAMMQENGWTQAELARALGKSRHVVAYALSKLEEVM